MAHPSLKKVVVKAPVKLNLALDILGVCESGYHEMDMIMQAIGLYETIEVARSQGYSLRCPGSRVPTGENNTATKVAAAFFQETGILAGADITLHKKAPTRAGMGGGSADAAGVLIALNHLYSAKLSLAEMQQIGLTAGADVPFALLGGTARARGIGEITEPLPPLPPCWFAIAMPKQGVSTPQAYRLYDKLGSPVHPSLPAALAALASGQLLAFGGEMKNVLEYANGGIITQQIRRLLDAEGALGSMMTGSGAAVFGLFAEKEQALQAAKKLKDLVPEIFVVPPVPGGPEIVEEI